MATAADKVFSDLVTAILTGRLRPRDVISERDLVSRFGVSRTPVREAVKRLIERGFLEPSPKGAKVLDISREDLKQLYELRMSLERQGAALTVQNITAKEIKELREINDSLFEALERRDFEQMLEIRSLFHAKLVHATRNRWLAEVLIMLRDKAYVLRHLHWQDITRASETPAIHASMIEALKVKDHDGYAQLVVDQIRASIDWYTSRFLAHSAPDSEAAARPQPSRLQDDGLLARPL